MANVVGFFNPVFYAQEALIHLEKALGVAARIHLGYDAERKTFDRGDTVNIKSPSTFSVSDAPSTAADLLTKSVQIVLNQWREVKFKLTDKELAFTSERIIDQHIRPAAYALADDIDQKLVTLFDIVPWTQALTYDGGTPTAAVVGDVTAPRKVLFDNAVPLGDVANMHYMIDSGLEQSFLNLSAFAQNQGAGDTGVSTQMRGTLGTKYGLEVFANQNVKDTTAGSLTHTSPITDGADAIGDTSIVMDETTITGTLTRGDVVKFANHSQKYAVTATATASGNSITFLISPPLVAAVPDATAVTVETQTNYRNNMAFHRNAFALVTAPLTDMANQLGARVASVQDPITGLSLRSRVYYVGNSSEVHVALDVLYGVKELDVNLAVRAVEDIS